MKNLRAPVLKATLFVLLVVLVKFQLLSANLPEINNNTAKVAEGSPQLTGRIVWKGDPNYEKDRLVSNYYTSKNKFPKVIVYCQNTKDVQNAVIWAVSKKIPIRIRSGGHQHEGYSTGNESIIIDVSEMKEIQIDKSTGIATIQPGLNNFELYSKLFKEGLTHVGGTCSEVGISGLILSGGIGPLLRRKGLSCDNLISVEIVDAKGQLILATKDNENKDLFWATCGGGGGNFGIITSMKIKVHPVQDVTWFNIGWDWNQPIDKIIAAWQAFFSKDNRNWFSHLDIWSKSFPSEKLKKQPVKALGFFYGSPDDARQQLAPLLKIGKPAEETFELVNWDKAIKLIEDSTAVFLTDKPEYKSSGAFVMNSLPTEALSIINLTLKESTSPLLNVLIFSMGGAVADIGPTDTAYFYRKAKFFINYSSQWLHESQDQKHKDELAALRQRLLPYTIGDYIGNPDPNLNDYLVDYYGSNSKRLQHIKQKYDPDDIFHFEQSIPPSSQSKK